VIKLLPEQEEDSDKLLLTRHLPNYSEAGSGKTLTTLAAIKKRGYTTGTVIAPVIALHMWKEWIESYLGLNVVILKGGNTKRYTSEGNMADFYVVSYGTVINPSIKAFLYEIGGEALVLDESKALKNITAKRTVAVYGRYGDGKGGLFERFHNTYPLDGTPITKHNDDMWSQLRAGFPDVLEEYEVLNQQSFMRKFCILQMKKYHPRAIPTLAVVASQNNELLHELIFERIGALNRKLIDISPNMPERTERNLIVPLKPDAELSRYLKGMSGQDIERAMAAGTSGMSKAQHTFGLLKAPPCAEYIVEQAQLGPVVVGYWHKTVGNDMARIVADTSNLTWDRVDGSTSMDDREEIRVAFNNGEIDVLFGQISAMGVAWNLQEAGRHVIIVEDNFSPGMIEQFIRRVWRMGQKRHVQIDFLHADHPLDDVIKRVRGRKDKAANIVMGR
jgi:SNF2 family DNA or RNA helicase